jgi:hypothetical protein
MILCITSASTAVARSAAVRMHSKGAASETRESTGDDSLEANEESFIRHLSKGWFPQPYSLTQVGFANASLVHVWENVGDLRSASFAPTRKAFTTDDPFIDDEDRIKKKFSNDDATGDSFSVGYRSDGLVWAKSVPFLSCLIRAHASYDRHRTAMYAVDNTKKFVTSDGVLQSLKEVSVLRIEQERCNIGVSALIPVYGIYIDTELAELSSLYFLSVGINTSFLVHGRFTQYTQIARPKELIRMANGTDTSMVRQDAVVATMQPMVASVTLSCGWMVGLRGSTFVSFEPFVSAPLGSVLSDASWHQVLAGLRFAIGFERD